MHFFRRALILKAGILHGRGAPWETEKGNRYGIPFLQGYGLPPFAAGAGLYAPAHAGAGRHRHRLRARRGAGDEAVRGGITYFDVAYPYHGGGAEKFIGAALEKYPRESFYLATKMPLWKLETQEDMEQVFNEQLANCRVDYFDFYLCHAVDAERFEKIRRIGAFEFLARKKAEGKIRRLGFSFHDKPAVLRAICAAYPWDFAQLQLNYLDWTVQRAREQYEILQEYCLAVHRDGAVRGGALASLCRRPRRC